MQHDAGQAVVPLITLMVMAVLAVLGVARLAERVIVSNRAQVAADAAALAAVQAGAEAAVEAAQRNGATVVTIVDHEGDVTIEVALDGHQAQARASR